MPTYSFSYTINPLPTLATITVTNITYVGGTTTLSNATSGGVWSSSNTSVGTINSSGLVTGITFGTSTISYTVTNANTCSTTATSIVAIYPKTNG